MPFTLTMPKLSPTMDEGTITKWRKQEGDLVKAGDVLFDVATDKATVEYNAIDDGYLRKILITEGKEAKVNQPVAIFTATKDESIEGYQPEGLQPEIKKEPASEAAKSSEEKTVPQKEEPPKGAFMQQPAFVPEPPYEQYVFPYSTGPLPERVKASPLARKLAREKGIDLTTVKGTGPQDRITSRDLDLGQPDALVTFGRREMPSLPSGEYEEESLTPMRKAIAQRLQQSKTYIPHFYVTQEIDAEPILSQREQLKAVGLKVTFNDMIVRAAALALREHPEVNSGYNSVNASIIRFKTIDISIAVSVPAGLITPIVRYADFKNLGQISSEVKLLAQKAKDGKLAREEYMGGSFTISNLGMFGVSEFKGIINPPQAAILCVSGIEEKPVVRKGAVVPGKVMMVTLAADHRVIDGADGAKFIKTLQKYLENPASLLI
jgi:pyruvate dehydrogenase E2 component (dihydrolipoamide acetyltransferase)